LYSIGKPIYQPVLTVRHGKSPFLIGEPSINGPFSMAMLNNQMVYPCYHIFRSTMDPSWDCHVSVPEGPPAFAHVLRPLVDL
jgi:hypothetical protein